MANVGQGSIDWKRVFSAADVGGVKHYIVEHDNPKSIDDLAGSYQYLRKLSF
jgi:sugar phosphate isomerase/epimerase